MIMGLATLDRMIRKSLFKEITFEPDMTELRQMSSGVIDKGDKCGVRRWERSVCPRNSEAWPVWSECGTRERT